jgi:hypothetical protein
MLRTRQQFRPNMDTDGHQQSESFCFDRDKESPPMLTSSKRRQEVTRSDTLVLTNGESLPQLSPCTSRSNSEVTGVLVRSRRRLTDGHLVYGQGWMLKKQTSIDLRVYVSVLCTSFSNAKSNVNQIRLGKRIVNRQWQTRWCSENKRLKFHLRLTTTTCSSGCRAHPKNKHNKNP